MSNYLIKPNPSERRQVNEIEKYLNVSEFYYDTIQGEGITAGVPAMFLRLHGCFMKCSWCDTQAIWEHGNPYEFDELIKLMELTISSNGQNLIERLKYDTNLVITGGSPLLQQKKILMFLEKFRNKHHFIPYVEIENECGIELDDALIPFVRQWNNSPKLANNGQSRDKRYNPDLIKYMASLANSWFKFVIENEGDVGEILSDYVYTGLVKRNHIILMPQGKTRKEILKRGQMVVDMAVKHGLRYGTREHIILWNQKYGV